MMRSLKASGSSFPQTEISGTLPVKAKSRFFLSCSRLCGRGLGSVFLYALLPRFKDRAEFKQSDQTEEAEHDPGENTLPAVGDIKDVPANQAQGKQEGKNWFFTFT